MRWAKLQQNIIIAYSLAMYQWKNCDENGQVITDVGCKRPSGLDFHQSTVMPSAYCKLVRREGSQVLEGYGKQVSCVKHSTWRIANYLQLLFYILLFI